MYTDSCHCAVPGYLNVYKTWPPLNKALTIWPSSAVFGTLTIDWRTQYERHPIRIQLSTFPYCERALEMLQSVATSLSEKHQNRVFTRYQLINYNKWSLLEHHVNPWGKSLLIKDQELLLLVNMALSFLLLRAWNRSQRLLTERSSKTRLTRFLISLLLAPVHPQSLLLVTTALYNVLL